MMAPASARATIDPHGALTAAVLRPLSDLFLWAWQLERRTEFLYRPAFDRWARPVLFELAQAVQNLSRRDEGLALVEERLLEGEEELIQDIIDQLALFTRENWLPGSAQRFGNTKTFGVLRGELEVRDDLPAALRHGVLAEPRTFPAWVRFSGPGPFAPPDIADLGQCSVGIKLMDVPGPKLMDDEARTQDLILVSPASFVTPDIRENALMQHWVRAKAPLGYALDPANPHLLHLFMQLLYSPMHANPLEVRYYSNVPFLLGAEQAVQYSLRPVPPPRSRIPAVPAENYLRDAMVRTLAAGEWSFDLMVQVQTDPHRMPIEDSTVKWPERLSPYVPVARLRLPAQRFDSDAQLAFADALRFNPWHSRPEHRPLGNSNRARYRMYLELARLRQAMNDVAHVEPTGEERFDERAGPALALAD
ncbi:catalase family protein [Actinomycetospora aeridis]|uniref:Catalase family protein n=1 Tax=Actinomycetospora aeridis TaxID=3129231 RepID=A0ABU8NC31_9PSEU